MRCAGNLTRPSPWRALEGEGLADEFTDLLSLEREGLTRPQSVQIFCR